MGYSLSQETASVLHEVRPQPTLDELKASIAPALQSAQAELAQATAEEESIRSQLDAKLTDVSSKQATVDKYQKASDELNGLGAAPVQG
jgi:multidrug resistance efflux pump